MRICSLLPSATEIVCALGLGDSLVAVTHECDYPEETSRLPAVTRNTLDYTYESSRDIDAHVRSSVHNGSSIYSIDQDLLRELSPDLILTQELCEVCAVSYGEVQKAVRSLHGDTQVLSLEPTSLDAILETISEVGRMTGVEERANILVRQARDRIRRVIRVAQRSLEKPTILALEWLDPPFIGGHWVPEMVRLAGGRDMLGSEGLPSSKVSWDIIASYNPEVIVLMPCGFDLERTIEEMAQIPPPEQWLNLAAVRSNQVYAVDGSSYFNRPGPRIVDGLEVLGEILHPELFPRTKPTAVWQHLESVRSEERYGT